MQPESTLLNPARLNEMYDRFDVERSYDELYRQSLAMSPFRGMRPTSTVNERGFDLLPCLTPAQVATYCNVLFDEEGTGRFNMLPSAALNMVLDSLLTPAMHEAIVTAFGTHYAFLFGAPDTSLPSVGEDPTGYSYKWHCDGGPRRHLKIIVYLDGPDAHDGGTMCLDRTTSDKMAKTGYFFSPLTERLSDLSGLAAEAGITPFEPVLFTPPAGTAILFEPTKILHRGVRPTWGRRRVFTAGLVPMPIEWASARSAFEPLIRSNTGFDFPYLEV
jgi:hypothetical protein